MSAIIAKAMNSTIGTDNFKSFDEILMSQKTVVPDSEAILCSLNIHAKRPIQTEEFTVATFTVPITMSVNLIYNIGLPGQSNTSSRTAIMKIYRNENKIYEAITMDKFSNEIRASTEIYAKGGDVITITMGATYKDYSNNLYLSLYSLNGKVECPPVNIISEYGG